MISLEQPLIKILKKSRVELTKEIVVLKIIHLMWKKAVKAK